MEIRGRVIQNLGLQSGTSKSGKSWSKCELLIETAENPQYPKKVKITNIKKADEFSKIPIGADVVFSVEIESREFNERWYTDVSCWKWEMAQQVQPQAAQGYPQQPYQQPPTAQPYYGNPQYAQPVPAQPFYGPAQSYPVNPQSATPNLDSLGVQGHQQRQFPQSLPPAPGAAQDSDDLPF